VTLDATLRVLAQLNVKERWPELRARALEAVEAFPDSADMHAFVAHAMRQLGELEPGYQHAVRGLAIDPQNLFARNRVSLLANLTQRPEEAWQSALPILERVPGTAGDAQNIAVTISNAMHAAIALGRVTEAVALFTPAIERLDHNDLHFNSACLFAFVRDDRAFAYMRKSLANGKPKSAYTDGDFNGIRADPRFVALLVRDWDAERAALARSGKASREDLVPEDFLDGLQAGVLDPERHVELERAIDAAVDDPIGYDVYADWLLGQSNARGELILASRRCAVATGEDERMLAYLAWADHMQQHAGSYLGAHAPSHGATRWHLGFVRELAFASKGDALALLTATLGAPVCRFVHAISIGDLALDDYTPILDIVRETDLPHLRALAIVPDEPALRRLDLRGVALPQLTSLVVAAGWLELGTLEFPVLEELTVRTHGLSLAGLDEILGARSPRLRHLGIAVSALADHLCAILVESRLLSRLDSLDLSQGELSEAAARTLVEHAAYFAHLKLLDVSANHLTPDDAAAVQRALPNAWIGQQR
jgi:uncharacterized protein (TIGR02996 family)